jgi:hypothetical protein
MENTGLNNFREVLRHGMIQNFEKDGYLTPVVFFYIESRPIISMIPVELLKTPEGKLKLAEHIRCFCESNPVLAAGIIMEADAAKIGQEKFDEFLKSDAKVKDLAEKQDVIVMIFSTPEKEEMISYAVDVPTKKVLGIYSEDSDAAGVRGGKFSNLFSWRKN